MTTAPVAPPDSAMRGFAQQFLNNAVGGELNPFIDDHDGSKGSRRRRGEIVADVLTLPTAFAGGLYGFQAFRGMAANGASQFGARALPAGPGMGVAKWAGLAMMAGAAAWGANAIADLIRGGADEPGTPPGKGPDDGPGTGVPKDPGYAPPTRRPKGRGGRPKQDPIVRDPKPGEPMGPKPGPITQQPKPAPVDPPRQSPGQDGPKQWFDDSTVDDPTQSAPTPGDVSKSPGGVEQHDAPAPVVPVIDDSDRVRQYADDGDCGEPAKVACPDDPCIPNTYVVKKGDSLSKIAAKWGMDWKQLYWLNRDSIDHPDLIYPGQEFVVPQCPIKVPDFPYTPLNRSCDPPKSSPPAAPPKSPPKGDPAPPKAPPKDDPEPPKDDPEPPKAAPPTGDPEPVKQEPVEPEPVKQQPIEPEPVKQEPVKQEPVVQEPVVQEPVKQEPVVQQPVGQSPVQSPIQAPVQAP